MAAFSRWEVICGKAKRYQDETGEVLTKACLINGKYYLPEFLHGMPWTHRVSFYEIVHEHLLRDIERNSANANSQYRRNTYVARGLAGKPAMLDIA